MNDHMSKMGSGAPILWWDTYCVLLGMSVCFSIGIGMVGILCDLRRLCQNGDRALDLRDWVPIMYPCMSIHRN